MSAILWVVAALFLSSLAAFGLMLWLGLDPDEEDDW